MSDTGKLAPEVYSTHEVRAIIATCSWRAPTGVRDRALISLLLQAGLRIQEALDLEVPDVRLDDGTLHVRHGKGDKARFAAIAGDPRFLREWLALRGSISLPGKLVFCSVRRPAGERLSWQAVDQMVKRRAAKAGLEQRVHLHGFRHSHAHELVKAGVKVTDIQQQLGHENLATTQAYLRKIAPLDRIAAVRAVQF
jgi:site-specific recombinase XerD